MTDTTTEAVERLAQTLRDDADANERARYQPYTDGRMRDAAATLRALAQERDALVKERDEYESPAWEANERLNEQRDELIAERDAARAEVERLRLHIADIHNRVRHEFSAEVEAAADKAFKAMSGMAALAAKGET